MSPPAANAQGREPAPRLRPLRHKVMLPLLVLGLSLSAIVTFAVYALVADQLLDQLEKRAEQIVHGISVAADSFSTRDELQRVVSAMSAEPDVTLIIVAAGDTPGVIAASRLDWVGEHVWSLPEEASNRELEQVFASRRGSVRHSSSTDEFELTAPLLLSEASLASGELRNAMVAVHVDVRTVRGELLRTAYGIAASVLAALLLLLAFAWWQLRYWVVHPVERIGKAIEQRHGGDAGALQKVASNDELGQLVHTLADALDRISSNEQQLRDLVQQTRAANASLGAEIRQRAQVEEALVTARDAAESASRAKSEFLATMSHEIRTPLNGVIGFANLLLDAELDAEPRDFARTIKISAENLLTIINDVLDFSKVEAGRLELEEAPYDLGAAVEEVTELLAAQADRKGLELALSYADDAPRRISGDGGRVRQVLLNLIGNAVKFTPKGHVLVDVSVEDDPAVAEQRHVRIRVKDTGIGIAADRQHLLFEKFTQADSSTTRRYGGTGLGLAISKKLVELMGGRIGLISRENDGSTFWFTLPVRAAEVSLPAGESLPQLRQLRVLVVDDLEINREVMSRQLRGWQIEHACADSGAPALRLLREAASAGRPFQVALLDHLMPEMDGEQLGREILADAALRSVALVLITSGSQRAEARRFLEAGFAAFLLKPIVRPLQLLETLRVAALGGARESTTDPAITTVTRRLTHDGLPTPPKTAPTRFVLLAEDNPVNAKLATRLLERLGCRVALAGNGIEAVAMVQQMPFDAVFMDCQMPEMDGLEASRAIRRWEQKTRADSGAESPRRLPIIALTANAMEGDRQRCLDAGMDDYITKPIDPADLRRALETAVTRVDTPAGNPDTAARRYRS